MTPVDESPEKQVSPGDKPNSSLYRDLNGKLVTPDGNENITFNVFSRSGITPQQLRDAGITTPQQLRELVERYDEPQGRFIDPGITPEQFRAAIEKMDGTLSVPKSTADAEFILWHKGQLPDFRPTAGQLWLSAALHAKASQQSVVPVGNPKNGSVPPGHSKKKIPPDDVQEIIRMEKRREWKEKYPIDICRAYIRGKHKDASNEIIETMAQSLKRKRNRY